MIYQKLCLVVFTTFVVASCSKEVESNKIVLPMGSTDCFFGGEKTETETLCNQNVVSKEGAELPFTVLRDDIENGAKPGEMLEIRNGGYGSDMVAHPSNNVRFYALTDRGANATFTGEQGKGKKFPTPDYTPKIGLFELQKNGQVTKIKDILLKRPDGQLITGLPNSSALGGTGETPYDANGQVIVENMSLPYDEKTNPIKLDDYGLDGEGLVALSDGSFWVSDEYGPHMVHFNSEGVEIGRINAFSNDQRTNFNLPAEFSNRRANRGMEGLAITPDETTLVGIMQSTMYNPNSSVKVNNLVRIVTVNLENGNLSQYLYKQEKTQNSQSGIVALSGTEFIVIERDGSFLSNNADAMKRIYKIDISQATDLEAISSKADVKQDDELGLLINGLTLEQITLETTGWELLNEQNIMPVKKTLVADLVEEVKYPHDKLEGLWLINKNTLGVLNDDDFATWSTKGVLEQKYLDADKTVIDGNRLYIIEGLNL